MPLTKEQILTEAKALGPEDRQALIDELWLTLDNERAATEAAWVAECRRRIEAVDRGEMATIPGAQVMRELRERLSRK